MNQPHQQGASGGLGAQGARVASGERMASDIAGGSDARGGPARRARRVPPAAAALALAATALVFAAIAIVAGSAGPLTARSRPVGTGPPPPPAVDSLPVTSYQIPPLRPGGVSGQWLWWIGFALSVLVAAAILWWLLAAVRRRVRPAPPAVGRAPAPLAAVALGNLGEPADVDLGDARTFRPQRSADDIIASFDAVERAAASFGRGRRPSATATEFLAGLAPGTGDARLRRDRLAPVDSLVDAAVLAELLPAGTARASAVLLRLYQRARFDTVALVPGAATLARVAARELIDALDLPGRARAEAAAGPGSPGSTAPAGPRSAGSMPAEPGSAAPGPGR